MLNATNLQTARAFGDDIESWIGTIYLSAGDFDGIPTPWVIDASRLHNCRPRRCIRKAGAETTRSHVWSLDREGSSAILQDIDEELGVGDHREYFIGTVLVSPTTQIRAGRASFLTTLHRRHLTFAASLRALLGSFRGRFALRVHPVRSSDVRRLRHS